MIPGEFAVAKGELELNKGRKTVTVSVTNSGDRPEQVGSHDHFFETTEALKFERRKAYGFRLNIAAGTAVRSLRQLARQEHDLSQPAAGWRHNGARHQ